MALAMALPAGIDDLMELVAPSFLGLANKER